MLPKCLHHWMLSATETKPLRRKQAEKYPDCIGRPAVCKKCGKKTTLPEHVDNFAGKMFDDD